MATERMLQRITSVPAGTYSEAFIEEFKVFTKELREFFNASGKHVGVGWRTFAGVTAALWHGVGRPALQRRADGECRTPWPVEPVHDSSVVPT